MVDEEAALEAVREGRLRGAAFDVFEREPLPDDAPHWREPGVLVSPHVAGTTDRFMEHLAGIVEAIWHAAFRAPSDSGTREEAIPGPATATGREVLARYRVRGAGGP